MMVTLGEGKNTMTIEFQFLVILCKSVYNCILFLGRPFTEILDTVSCSAHLKLKYHNVHEDLVTICIDMSEHRGYTKP